MSDPLSQETKTSESLALFAFAHAAIHPSLFLFRKKKIL
jgi:hypothetical protein